MTQNSYSFKLGDFTCLVINDGKCSIPDKLHEQHSQGSGVTNIELDTTTLLVRTGKNTILIDTGWGTGTEVEPHEGQMVRNMEAAGIRRKEIDTVIFSHGHVDHIGGTIDTNGNPVFPNARFFMFRKEWEFCISGSDFSRVPENVRQSALLSVQKNLFPLKDKINLFDDEKEIVPGISYIAAPGHSPGHIALIISSGTERLLCPFDAFHHPMEIEKPDLFLVPPGTGEAGETRAKLISQAAAPGVLVFACHFPFPGLGHIVKKKGIWHWQPIS